MKKLLSLVQLKKKRQLLRNLVATVLTIVFSESINKNEKGKLVFDAMKAVELGLTKKKRLNLKKLLKSVIRIADLAGDAICFRTKR
ncbi:hypothetical protein ACEQPO_11840 [Bacillus sp. SL00103]